MKYLEFKIRYHLCAISLKFSMWVMPEGAYKKEFYKRVLGLRDEAMNQPIVEE